MKPLLQSRLFLATLAALVLVGSVSAQQRISADRARQRALMQQKLFYTQKVLEGLTLENYSAVTENAIKMRDLTHREDWFIYTNPDYKTATTNFSKAVDAVYMAALDKQQRTGTEAFKRVVDSCVACHTLFRVEQMKTTKPKR